MFVCARLMRAYVQMDVYLHVTSTGIIEACTGVRVAPNPMSAADGNNWANLKDFDWLAESEQSPNWAVLPESDRRTDFTLS
jgi:hypothetical protein